MTSLHPARRHAERFDALVEARLDGDGVDARTAELLELVGALRAVPEPQPRPEFVGDLRERLMLAARTELTPAEAPRRARADEVTTRLTIKPRRTRRERRLTAAIGAVAIVGATSSMAVASQGALPGDPLYPVKRAIESTQTGFTVSDAAKGRTTLGNASDRLAEVRDLSRRDDVDASLVRNTLGTFSDQASQGSDLLLSDYEQQGDQASVEQVHAFAASSMDTLAQLEADVPDDARPALLDAAQVLFTIDAAAEQVCPACAGEGITELPGQLLASAQTPPGDDESAVAVGPLEGTTPSTKPSPMPVSGAEPPSAPVQIPTQPAVPPLTLPTGNAGQQPTGQGQQPQGNNHGQGHSTKPKPTPTDLPGGLGEAVEGTVDGATGTANGAAGGALQGGVTGLLDGLANGLLGGGQSVQQPTQIP